MFKLPEGYRAYITHFRRFEGVEFLMTRFDAKTEGIESAPCLTGGATEAAIVDPEGNLLAVEVAQCSMQDSFSKEVGTRLATARALRQADIYKRRVSRV